jgi:hypothetical protein
MRSRSLHKEDTSTVHEPASRGDGRHCSLCWTGIYGTQPQVDQLATPEGAAGHRALPHRRAGRASRPLHRLRTYDPSPTTRAETGIAQDARATRADAGSRRANGNCCPLAMSTPSSLCRGNWPRSHCRTSGSSTTCSFTRALRPCLKSLAIHGISEPRSASSACSTAGISACSFILISTASLPPAVSLRITQAGSPPGAPSSCPSACSAASSAASSSKDFATHSIEASSSSTAALLPLAQPRAFAAWLRVLFRHDWVVYSKQPFGGPEHVLRYLGAYTHRVAISNSRLVALADGNVTFRWRDSAHGNKKRLMTLAVDEFLRRFLLHLLPPGFVRIRNFGFLANRNRATLLPLCLQLLGGSQKTPLRRHHRPPIRFTHSGTAQSAAEPCTSSNGSPPRNSCFALHLNQTGAPHEALFPSSALHVLRRARRSLVSSGQNPRMPAISFQPPHRTPLALFYRSSRPSKRRICPTQSVLRSLCTRSGRFKVHRLP